MTKTPAPSTALGAPDETPRNSKARSTASEAQRARIIDALRSGPKTSHDLRCLGCYQAPARIKELRDRYGFDIRTERVTLYDRDGYMHRGAARYHLEAEPTGTALT